VTDQPAQPPPPEPAWTAPPAPQPSTRPGPMPGWHYAGFWVRFLAFLIDAILLGVVSAAFTPVWGPQVTTTGANFEIHAQANAIGTLISLIYFAGFGAWRGQTVGMRAFNMQVVGVAVGQKIDVVRGLLRYVGFIIAAIPLLIGLIWAAFDARKQGWHDKIASTVVIRPN
jgi:uncharacterized RDD family membrane protein YckC